MPILRVKHIESYTVINNNLINDSRISFKALGIAVFFLSKPDNWNINIKYLTEKNNKGEKLRLEGKDAISSALKELEEFGYLKKVHKRDSSGQFKNWEYWLSESSLVSENTKEEVQPEADYPVLVTSPEAGYPEAGYPKAGFPILDNPPLINTDLLTSTDPLISTDINKYQKIKTQPLSNKGISPRISKNDVMEIFECWKQVWNHSHSKLDKDREKYIRAAFHMQYTKEQLKNAIEGSAKTPHNQGINEHGQVYDGIHVIFKNADQIDRFIKNFFNPPQNKTKRQLEVDEQANICMNWAEKKLKKMQEKEANGTI